jgi:hypothetical protein
MPDRPGVDRTPGGSPYVTGSTSLADNPKRLRRTGGATLSLRARSGFSG